MCWIKLVKIAKDKQTNLNIYVFSYVISLGIALVFVGTL